MNYFSAAAYLTAAALISAINDACMKFLPYSVHSILFFRFAIGSLVLLPLIKYNKIRVGTLVTKPHLFRAIMFSSAMMLFLYALKQLPLATVTIINFSTPIWVILLASYLLNEPINKRFIPIIIAICGVVFACLPWVASSHWQPVMMLIVSTIAFAILDVFNKYLTNHKEPILVMLFTSSLGGALLFSPFAIIPQHDLLLLCWLGIGSNLLFYCLLKAWQAADIAALQTIRFIEFPIAAIIGSALFGDVLTWHTFIGFLFVATGIMLNLYHETKRNINT